VKILQAGIFEVGNDGLRLRMRADQAIYPMDTVISHWATPTVPQLQRNFGLAKGADFKIPIDTTKIFGKMTGI
jgi:hypothetical protein